MTNKSKNIGTWTETQVVRYLNVNGFGGAERIALHGVDDQGDVSICPGLMCEVKGGNAAETASDTVIAGWLTDTERERRARGADVAFLVWKRKGKGGASAGQWWAAMHASTYLYLATQVGGLLTADDFRRSFDALPAVRMTLADAVNLTRRGGYGDAICRDDEPIDYLPTIGE